jgi:hypothetical protein
MPTNPTVARQERRLNASHAADKLGKERAKLDAKLVENTQAIIDLMPEALSAGLPFDGYAQLVGVSRQTLYRWQKVARRLNG